MRIARNSNLFIGDFRSTVSAFIGLDIEDKDNKCIDVTRPYKSSRQLIHSKIYWKYENNWLSNLSFVIYLYKYYTYKYL